MEAGRVDEGQGRGGVVVDSREEGFGLVLEVADFENVILGCIVGAHLLFHAENNPFFHSLSTVYRSKLLLYFLSLNP